MSNFGIAFIGHRTRCAADTACDRLVIRPQRVIFWKHITRSREVVLPSRVEPSTQGLYPSYGLA